MMSNSLISPSPPPGLPCWAAHTPTRQEPTKWHSLPEHALTVATLAESFAGPFGGAALARYIGLLHDLGKFSDTFQGYLQQCHAAAQQKVPPPPPGSAPHKQAGARVAERALGGMFGTLVAQALHGHHGGMKDAEKTANEARAAFTNAEVDALLERARAVDPELAPIVPDRNSLATHAHLRNKEALEMYIRFVFSCLTDADGLDTEAHHNPDEAARRRDTPTPSLVEMRDELHRRQAALVDMIAKAGATAVNMVRREVYEACRAKALLPPGVFTLTVPTGGGKTRSSLAFALDHAVKHEKRRVVYAIPYTSIVDQTAGVFRDLFPDSPGYVLEHHSAIEPPDSPSDAEGGEAEAWRRLAAQNWDAPLVVTTTVQLFESLFSNRPGKCRKLHRLANSVIVLDEVQTLPPHLLTPLVAGLKTLCANFGVTVVLCTATQPALNLQSRYLAGFENPTAIIDDPKRHFEVLRRVRYRRQPEPMEWQEVAGEMRATDDSCLCIVNTRQQALDLLAVLDPTGKDPSVLHLSTLLCGHHRRSILHEVKQRLKEGRRVLLVSTQLIEAGVDVDFPRVLRAMGPLDRIIQAAGRCNREGLRSRDTSEVVLFTPADDRTPQGIYRMAHAQTLRLMARTEAAGIALDFDDPALVTTFFASLYADIGSDLDARGIQKLREAFRYDDVAANFRLIEEDTVPVLITTYADAPEGTVEDILNEAKRAGRMTRELWRRAQPFCVSIRARDAQDIEEVYPGLRVWRGEYGEKTGFPLTRKPGDNVVYRPDSLQA